jgi:hypothetical protein
VSALSHAISNCIEGPCRKFACQSRQSESESKNQELPEISHMPASMLVSTKLVGSTRHVKAGYLVNVYDIGAPIKARAPY